MPSDSQQSSVDLRCDMLAACERPISMIGNKGYIYCRECGVERRSSGNEHVRKLAPWELRRLQRGEALTRY